MGRENCFCHTGTRAVEIQYQVFKIAPGHRNPQKYLMHDYHGQLLAYDITLALALIQIEQFDGSLEWIEFANSGRIVFG